MLEVVGKAGSGKTSLYLWTVDLLQRRVLGKIYSVVDYSIDPAMVVETSSARLVQSLLSLMLERDVGNIDIIKQIATTAANTSNATNLSKRN